MVCSLPSLSFAIGAKRYVFQEIKLHSNSLGNIFKHNRVSPNDLSICNKTFHRGCLIQVCSSNYTKCPCCNNEWTGLRQLMISYQTLKHIDDGLKKFKYFTKRPTLYFNESSIKSVKKVYRDLINYLEEDSKQMSFALENQGAPPPVDDDQEQSDGLLSDDESDVFIEKEVLFHYNQQKCMKCGERRGRIKKWFECYAC